MKLVATLGVTFGPPHECASKGWVIDDPGFVHQERCLEQQESLYREEPSRWLVDVRKWGVLVCKRESEIAGGRLQVFVKELSIRSYENTTC